MTTKKDEDLKFNTRIRFLELEVEDMEKKISILTRCQTFSTLGLALLLLTVIF